jgi:glycosyltransferase involved in cell wall biosynthesis
VARHLETGLRILMVSPQPFFQARGTPVSVLHRIRALQRLGHQVDLVTYPFGEDPNQLPGLRIHRSARPPLVRDVPIGPSVAKLLLDGPLFVQARRMALEGKYDLIHTHEEASLLGAHLSRDHGLPHLYDMHSSLPEQFENFGRFNWGPVRSFFEWTEAFSLRHSAGVITVYPELRDKVCQAGFDGPLALIENTLDFDSPPPDPERELKLRRELDIDGHYTVVYTGTLESYQGMDLLVEAGARLAGTLPDLRIVSVGGTANQIDDLRRKASDAGAGSIFRFVEMVPPEDVFYYHRLADALVTCRIKGTNTPLKLYQYLGSNRPIVATRIHSHTQVLNDEVAELVPPSAEGVAAGIRALHDDPDRAAGMADRARRLKEEEYSHEAYLRALSSLLEGIMNRTPAMASGRSNGRRNGELG